MERKMMLMLSLLMTLMVMSCGKNSITQIKTDEVVKNIENPEYVIIDTRDDSLYNGFKDKGAKRGGHIKGAKQFTCSWFDYIQEEKFDSFSAGKGITKDKTLVIYGTNVDDTNCVSAEFATRGYKVKTYTDFIEYANDEKNPMESYENFHYSVSPEWVNSVMNGEKPETYNNDKFMIFETSWGPLEEITTYRTHIPGAYHFNTDWVENGPIWNLSDAKIVEENLLKAGITKDKTIILYSDNQLAAYRIFWALKWAGVDDVRVMNGNLSTWVSAGYKVETKVNIPTPEQNFGVATFPANPGINISLPDEAIARQNEGLKLISNRAWDEYLGKITGYDDIERMGEPAGAIWGFAGTDSSNMTDYYDPDGTLRNVYEIIDLWKTRGINKGEQLAFYCGTGWRASVAWFMTQLAGWENTYVYDGGWYAWQEIDGKYPLNKVENPEEARPDSKNDYGKASGKRKASCKG